MPVEIITLTDAQSGATASILPARGFNCFGFRAVVDDQPIETLWAEPGFGPESRPSRGGIPLLFPFAGRIRGESFSFAGKSYAVPGAQRNGPNAIHGFVMSRPWRVVERSSSRAVGEFHAALDDTTLLDQWPADFRIRVAYEVLANALTASVAIDNPGDGPLPFTFGAHTYLRLQLGGTEPAACRVTVPAAEHWELDEGLPTGVRRPVRPDRDLRAGQRFGDVTLDDVLIGLAPNPDGRIHTTVHDPGSDRTLEQTFDASFRECVVFTPPHREAIAIEPYTGVPNPFELSERGIDAGLRVLAPGETFDARFELRLR